MVGEYANSHLESVGDLWGLLMKNLIGQVPE